MLWHGTHALLYMPIYEKFTTLSVLRLNVLVFPEVLHRPPHLKREGPPGAGHELPVGHLPVPLDAHLAGVPRVVVVLPAHVLPNQQLDVAVGPRRVIHIWQQQQPKKKKKKKERKKERKD